MKKQVGAVSVAIVALLLLAVALLGSGRPDMPRTVFVHYTGPDIAEPLYYDRIGSAYSTWPRNVNQTFASSPEAVMDIFTTQGSTVMGELEVLQLPEVEENGMVLFPHVQPHAFKPVRFVVKQESEIGTPEDLRGKKIAVDMDRTYGIVALAALESKYGITPTDVKITDVSGSREDEKLLAFGAVDAAVIGGKLDRRTPTTEITKTIWEPTDYFERRFNGSLPLMVFGISNGSAYERGLEVMDAVNASVVWGLNNSEEIIRHVSRWEGVKVELQPSLWNATGGLKRVSEEDIRFIQYLVDYAYNNGFTEERTDVSSLYAFALGNESGR